MGVLLHVNEWYTEQLEGSKGYIDIMLDEKQKITFIGYKDEYSNS
jgi:hypothetical protein